MSRAFSYASSGVCASFTPPALPRPPAWTCALITTVPPIEAATSRASSGVLATRPGSTGSPWRANSSLPWYSCRFMDPHAAGRAARSGQLLSICARWTLPLKSTYRLFHSVKASSMV